MRHPCGVLPLMLLSSSAASSLDGFTCNNMRNDTGFANHRELHVPSAMWKAAGAYDLAWAKKLCCVFTWVVPDNKTSLAFMITYDGSRRTYEDQSTVAEAAEGAYSAVCGMYMGSSDCDTASQRCLADTLNPTQRRKPKWGGSGAWKPGVAEGRQNSCNSSIQSNLRYGCSSMMQTAQHICCHNTKFAEPRWYFQDAGGRGGLFAHINVSGVTTFYDSACGIPLYRAPVGRSIADWKAESTEHGWPSFRRQETFMDNMVFRANGEIESVCGTHLGHNLPDKSGDRFCIDLICIAGSPLREEALDAAGKPASSLAVSAAVVLLLAAAAVSAVKPLLRLRRQALQEPLMPESGVPIA